MGDKAKMHRLEEKVERQEVCSSHSNDRIETAIAQRKVIQCVRLISNDRPASLAFGSSCWDISAQLLFSRSSVFPQGCRSTDWIFDDNNWIRKPQTGLSFKLPVVSFAAGLSAGRTEKNADGWGTVCWEAEGMTEFWPEVTQWHSPGGDFQQIVCLWMWRLELLGVY